MVEAVLTQKDEQIHDGFQVLFWKPVENADLDAVVLELIIVEIVADCLGRFIRRSIVHVREIGVVWAMFESV
jgi:hypothetical protein